MQKNQKVNSLLDCPRPAIDCVLWIFPPIPLKKTIHPQTPWSCYCETPTSNIRSTVTTQLSQTVGVAAFVIAVEQSYKLPDQLWILTRENVLHILPSLSCYSFPQYLISASRLVYCKLISFNTFLNPCPRTSCLHLFINEFQPAIHSHDRFCLILLQQHRPDLFVDVRILVEFGELLHLSVRFEIFKLGEKCLTFWTLVFSCCWDSSFWRASTADWSSRDNC